MNPKPRPPFEMRDSSSPGLIYAFRSYSVQGKCCHGRMWAGRGPFLGCRKTIAEYNDIGWLDVGSRGFYLREYFGPNTSGKCKVHARRTSTLRRLWSKQIAMSVYKEKSISSPPAKR